MKKIFSNIKTLAALLMVGAAFTACSNSDNDSIIVPTDNVKTYNFTIQASNIDLQPSTRVAINFDYNPSAENPLTIKWAGGETIQVYNKVGTNVGTLTAAASADGSSATLSGTLSGAYITEGNKLTLKIEPTDFNIQDGSYGTLGKQKFKAEATVTIANVEGTDVTATGTAVFENKQAIVLFYLYDYTSHWFVQPTKPDVGDYKMTVTVYDSDPSDGVVYRINCDKATVSTLFVTMDGFTGKKLNLQVFKGLNPTSFEDSNPPAYEYEIFTQENVTFENGNFYPIEVYLHRKSS